MEKHEIDSKIAEVSKSILSYCMTRTSTQHEAEDLAQDILLQLIKSLPNIRDDQAIYKFMWSVAGNVYSSWYRRKIKIKECELIEEGYYGYFDDIKDDHTEIDLLRRELSLMSEKYRKVTILYYLENKSCLEISQKLSISESMVKYLLFKARKILKEGMNMNRNYGEQSYNPKQLSLMYMGEGPNRFWQLLDSKAIPQNILWACYNDDLTGEEISLQIGVALPYLESELYTLVNAGILLKRGNRYTTNIVIMSKDFSREVSSKLADIQDKIADGINHFLVAHESDIRCIGFYGCNMSHNTYMWQMMCMVLASTFKKCQEIDLGGETPITAFGERAYVWGEEECKNAFNICQIQGEGVEIEDCMLYFMDWIENPKGTHHDFYNDRKLVNLFIRLAKGQVKDPNEYEKEMIVTLIKRGYVLNKNGELAITVPVYTQKQIDKVIKILDPIIEETYQLSQEIFSVICSILKNHTPIHLKQSIKGIARMRLFSEVVSAPAHIMHCKDYIKTNWSANEMPTTYIVIDETI